ncbi:hypothetical protein DFH27DRAFT_523564 [Peziza echinospora]|nr:hypothetical protein DFH27DRAFT_523564 [Peziza echinospora]
MSVIKRLIRASVVTDDGGGVGCRTEQSGEKAGRATKLKPDRWRGSTRARLRTMRGREGNGGGYWGGGFSVQQPVRDACWVEGDKVVSLMIRGQRGKRVAAFRAGEGGKGMLLGILDRGLPATLQYYTRMEMRRQVKYNSAVVYPETKRTGSVACKRSNSSCSSGSSEAAGRGVEFSRTWQRHAHLRSIQVPATTRYDEPSLTVRYFEHCPSRSTH